jgi:hypothetical protein
MSDVTSIVTAKPQTAKNLFDEDTCVPATIFAGLVHLSLKASPWRHNHHPRAFHHASQ